MFKVTSEAQVIELIVWLLHVLHVADDVGDNKSTFMNQRKEILLYLQEGNINPPPTRGNFVRIRKGTSAKSRTHSEDRRYVSNKFSVCFKSLGFQ